MKSTELVARPRLGPQTSQFCRGGRRHAWQDYPNNLFPTGIASTNGVVPTLAQVEYLVPGRAGIDDLADGSSDTGGPVTTADETNG